jgi:hypothetical protein
MFILGNIIKCLLSCMSALKTLSYISVLKTSVDNCQEALLRSRTKDTPPLLTSPMRLSKRDSIFREAKYLYPADLWRQCVARGVYEESSVRPSFPKDSKAWHSHIGRHSPWILEH